MVLASAPIDVINILLGIVAAIDFVLLATIFLNQRKDDGARFFVVAAFFAATWVLSMFFFRVIDDARLLIVPAKSLYVAGILIAHFLLLFSYEFLSGLKKAIPRWLYIFLTISTLIYVLLIIFTDTVISGVVLMSDGKIVLFGFLYIPYSIMMLMYFFVAYTNFFNCATLFAKNKNKTGHRQMLYIIIGTGLSVFLGLVFDIALPYLGDFRGYWFGPAMNILFVAATTYAILKHHLFNLKVIATEIFIFSLWMIMLVRVLSSQTNTDQFINGSVLVASVIIGILLIRSVLREVETREQIERLAGDLKTANERLRELDKLKSQFLSIASHDLRAPLTAIRNFMSLLLDGTYGKLPPAAEEGTHQVYERATEMAEMVDNYLNVSRIEQGKMKYDFADIDFATTLNETVKPFVAVAKEKGITLTYKLEPNSSHFPMKADEAKLREVIENLVSNSINYTPEGSISVTAEKNGNTARLTIKDTGIGMTEETKKNLFKLFNPGEDSRKYNPKSTGVGLYITKAHVEAHKGTLTAESAGKGQGSRFIVELPTRAKSLT